MENQTIMKIVKNKYGFVNKEKLSAKPTKEKYKKDCNSVVEIFQKNKK